jgi:ankyrin repeat protein
MDTVQKVLDDFKMLNPRINYIESINHIDDNIRDNCNPWNILMCACNNGHTDILKRCISLGADVNKLNFLNQHPLYLALLYFYTYGPSFSFSTAEILFKAGVSPNIKCEDIPILFYLHTGTEMTNFLLKHGALTNQFYKYKEFIKPESHMYFIKVLAKRRWVYLKTIVIILGVHKRAVVTANHPLRKLQRGEFNNSD